MVMFRFLQRHVINIEKVLTFNNQVWHQPKHPGNTWATVQLCSLLKMSLMSPNLFLHMPKVKRVLFKFIYTIICFWRPVAFLLVLLFCSDGNLMKFCPYSVSAFAISNLVFSKTVIRFYPSQALSKSTYCVIKCFILATTILSQTLIIMIFMYVGLWTEA